MTTHAADIGPHSTPFWEDYKDGYAEPEKSEANHPVGIIWKE